MRTHTHIPHFYTYMDLLRSIDVPGRLATHSNLAPPTLNNTGSHVQCHHAIRYANPWGACGREVVAEFQQRTDGKNPQTPGLFAAHLRHQACNGDDVGWHIKRRGGTCYEGLTIAEIQEETG